MMALRKYMLITVAILLIANLRTLLMAEESARDVLEKVRKTYDAIRDVELRFSQKVTFERTNLQEFSSGTLFMKKGNRYRLEVGDQVIVTDGTTVWSYSPTTQQVIIDRFKMDERSLSPDRILTGASDEFIASLIGKERVGGIELLALKLVPRTDQSAYRNLKLWIDETKWMVKRAEVVDVNGKKTEYDIEQMKTNTGLDDRKFVYEVPAGVEVVDLR
jgi:chaperone LolA